MAGKRNLDTSRQWGREFIKTSELQKFDSAPENAIFAVIDPNYIAADAQPRQMTLSGIMNSAVALNLVGAPAASGESVSIAAGSGIYITQSGAYQVINADAVSGLEYAGTINFANTSGALYVFQGDGTNDGAIVLNCSQNTHGVTLSSPPHAAGATYTLTLPYAAGTEGQVLATSGTGQLYFTDQTGGGGGGGSGEFVEFKAPVFTTLNDPDPVNQGETWVTTGTELDESYPGIAFYAYDYTGTGTYTDVSSTGNIGGQEDTPGTYTIKLRAGWPFGQSEEQTLTIQVNPFVLSRETMFGDVSNYQSYVGNSVDAYRAVGFTGAVVNSGGSYYLDRSGAYDAQALECYFFYDAFDDILWAFRISSGGTIQGTYWWSSISDITDGVVLPSGGTSLGNSGTQAAAIASRVQGKRVPFGGEYKTGMGGTKALQIIPTDNSVDNVFTRTNAWSYSVLLQDDWMSGAVFNQMLAPTGVDFTVMTIGGYAISTSPFEYIAYGDHDSGPFDTSSNSVTWNIATENYVIAESGQLVTVTYDGTNTTRFWKESRVIFQSTSPYTYYSTNTLTNPTLRFGDYTGSNVTTAPQTYGELGGWNCRFSDLMIAAGTEFSEAQISGLVQNKSDFTAAAAYSDVDMHILASGTGIGAIKGAASIERVNVGL